MEINFLACFRTYRLSRSAFANFSIARRETSSHLDVVIIVVGSIFASYVRRSAFTRLQLSISTSLERMCVGNAKRSEVHYRELGHDEYITRRIWPGYVQTWWLIILLDAAWHQLSTLESKKLLQTLWIVYVIIIYIKDVHVYFRN